MPDSVRARIVSRSNLATLARIWSKRRLVGLFSSVSSDWLVATNRTPVAGERRQLPIQIENGAPEPIMFQTAMQSNLRLAASAINLSSDGRLALAPEKPVSTYSPAILQSRREM